jgi:hypothetical protein
MWIMKRIRIFGLFLIIALSVGCKDARVASSEQRITGLEQRANSEEQRANLLEQRIKALEAKPPGNMSESMQQVNLESCVSQANAAFEKEIISKGTKTTNGSYNVPDQVRAELEKQKQTKIEQCKSFRTR